MQEKRTIRRREACRHPKSSNIIRVFNPDSEPMKTKRLSIPLARRLPLLSNPAIINSLGLHVMSANHTDLEKRLPACVSEILVKMIEKNHKALELEPRTTVR
jgi:hypothetical protein